MSTYEKYKVDIPEGESGKWRIERFAISADAARLHNALAACKPGMGARGVQAGTYTRLLYGGRECVMSDTPAEIRDHLGPICEAKTRGGVARVHGLGLGMVVAAMLNYPNVERVDVVELSPDVIALVAPTLAERYGERLRVIQGDALELKPKGARYSVVWHDIWPHISTDNWDDMKKLHRRWGRSADWQGSWARELVIDRIRRGY